MKNAILAGLIALLIPFIASAAAYAPAVGGTGTTTPPNYGQVLVGNAAHTYTLTATTSLGLSSFSTTSAAYWLTTKSTADLTEGSNLYWTIIRFDNRLSATTTLPNITTLTGLSLAATQITGFGGPFYTYFHATTTDALTEGTNNLYYTPTRFDQRLSATTSLPNITTLSNLGTVKTSLSGILKAASGVLSVASAGSDFQAPITATYPIQLTSNVLSLTFGTTTTNTWVHQIFASLVATNASSTNATTTSLYVTGVTNGLHAGGTDGRTYSAATSTVTAGTAISTSGNGAIVGSGLTVNFSAPLTAALSIPYASTTAISATTICITTDCRTAWPVAGASLGTVSTSSQDTAGQIAVWGTTNGYPAKLFSQATSTLTASAPLTGSLTQIGSGGSLGIQAASASQNGYFALGDFNLIHSATTTFSSPLVYTLSTNAVTCPTCSTSTFTYPFSVFNTFSTTTAATSSSIYTAGLFFSSSTAAASQFPYASTTAITATTASTTNLTVSSIKSVIPLMSGVGAMGAYGGSGACSNQFVTVLSAAGVGTCASVTDATISGQVGVAHGGTNIGSFTPGDMLYASQATVLTRIASTTSGFVLALVNGIPTWTATTTLANISGTLPIANGGTNATSMTTSGNATYYNGSAVATAPTTAAITIPYASSTVYASFATASTTSLFAGLVGIASTTPTMVLSIGTTGSNYGSIAVTENPVSTSTAITIDWKRGNQQLIRTGTAATAIGFNNASTSGQQLKLIICNPGSSAGAVTFTQGIHWAAGTKPTQTTTANQCDLWSFIVTQGTSTAASSQSIFGAATTGFQ